jgi:integrase
VWQAKRRAESEPAKMVEAHRQADAAQAGAVAAMTALVMGMRASEIVSRVVRDLDDGGALLWIPDSKTLAGRRKLQVPEFLQPYLVELARGRDPQAPLFGEHWRDWPLTRSHRRAVTSRSRRRPRAKPARGLTGGS